MSTPRAILISLLAALVIGCGGYEAPSASPGGMDDVIANLVLRGVTVQRLVSGDPGCPSSGLHSNAVHLELVIGSQSRTFEAYLMRWRRVDQFEAAAAPFADCVEEYRLSHPQEQLTAFELPPWRAFGPGWTERLSLTLEQALRATGGG